MYGMRALEWTRFPNILFTEMDESWKTFPENQLPNFDISRIYFLQKIQNEPKEA